jgi:hypothetical protein
MKLFKRNLNKAGIPYINDCTVHKDGIPSIDPFASKRVQAFFDEYGVENVRFCASNNYKDEPGVYVALIQEEDPRNH